MNEAVKVLKQGIQDKWGEASGAKVQRYVDKFWDRQRQEKRITAVVRGNDGNYTVSI